MRLLSTAIFLLAATAGIAQEQDYVMVGASYVVLHFWEDNFSWSLLMMLIVGWFIPKLFWFSRISILAKVMSSTICSLNAMIIIGALWAVFILIVGQSFFSGIGSITEDPLDALILFLALGLETSSGWLLTMIIRIFSLARYDIKSKNARG